MCHDVIGTCDRWGGPVLKRVDIEAAFRALAGKQLSIARLAGSGRNFHFGEMREYPPDMRGRTGSGGEYALHLACPWRIDGPRGTVTGSDDIWEYADEGTCPEGWKYEDGNSLQDRRLGELLGGYDKKTHSWINAGAELVVLDVAATDSGDVQIRLSGGYTLRIFPAISREESWRLFRPLSDERHVVFEAGPE